MKTEPHDQFVSSRPEPVSQPDAAAASGDATPPTGGAAPVTLRAAVLLGGSVRPTQLRRAVGRSILDMPVDDGRAILDCWQHQMLSLATHFGQSNLPVRVMIDHTTPLPRKRDWQSPVQLRIEHDPLEFRGTGGLMRDIASEYDDDDHLLVAGAAQLMIEPLVDAVQAMTRVPGDIRILALPDGTPTGVMLLRCGALRAISPVGYVDLKEQALPKLAEEYDVRVVRRPYMTGLPIRTRSSYLDAVRTYHRVVKADGGQQASPWEDWQSTFSLIEPGAWVGENVVLHDSVILAGAQVESDTVLVRSVVCPGGRLISGRWVVDKLVTADEQGPR